MDRAHDIYITSVDNSYCNVCRTIWLLALDVLPQPPPPQPWLHAQTDDSSERSGSAQEQGEFSEAQTPEDADEPEGLSDDEADIEAQMNQEIENLLREASETDSNPDIKKMDASEGQRAYNKNTRYTLVPVIYSDFVSLINTYQLPYLSVVPLLPKNMEKHLSSALRQELTPPHAPTVAALHVITRRIARRLHLVHGVDIPELNAAPILWRAVRAFQGPPMLYTMVKILMERLKVPLTIHPALAPAPAPGVAKYAGDWAPIEVTMSAIIIACLKLVYGFREVTNIVREEDDPAACFLPFSDYVAALREGKEGHHKSFDRLLTSENDRTADTLTEKEIDRYLEVAERALKTSRLGSLKSLRKYDTLSNNDPLTQSSISRTYPGEQLTIWSPEDPLGALPPDYALLILTASSWSGVHNSNINHLVAILERRLKRDRGPDIGGSQRSTPEDSESDGEHIDINQPDISEEESESNGESKDGLHHNYQMGSQKWRSQVHQKLAGSNRKGTPQTDEASSPQTSTPSEEFRT
ncbi:hypothetical protein RHS03_03880, partial [Rhizoctonia solani]